MGQPYYAGSDTVLPEGSWLRIRVYRKRRQTDKWMRRTWRIISIGTSDREDGGQGLNRTADTGIFMACKIYNLLIILEQGGVRFSWVFLC